MRLWPSGWQVAWWLRVRMGGTGVLSFLPVGYRRMSGRPGSAEPPPHSATFVHLSQKVHPKLPSQTLCLPMDRVVDDLERCCPEQSPAEPKYLHHDRLLVSWKREGFSDGEIGKAYLFCHRSEDRQEQLPHLYRWRASLSGAHPKFWQISRESPREDEVSIWRFGEKWFVASLSTLQHIPAASSSLWHRCTKLLCASIVQSSCQVCALSPSQTSGWQPCKAQTVFMIS